MDVLVTANQTPGRYYMVFSPFVDTTAPSNENITMGIFQYNGTYNHSETPVSPELLGFTNKNDAGNFTIQLRSLNSEEHPSTVPTNITRNITITVSVNTQPCPANKTCSGLDGGVWFMHCHLERHASWGMDTVLIVGDGKEKHQKVFPPPKDMPPCTVS
ncbi:hypothetical protein NL676_007711 [Syzygium grande]|nr:hypothetical protein NL676_007711 [Syzygium grande]